MERLTKWNGSSNQYAYFPRCFEEPCNGGGCKIKDCPFETAVCERLATFEDIAELIGGVARLRELAEADKDGRCVVLPCKVGDTAYYLNGPYIIGFKVTGYMVDERGAWSFRGEYYDPEAKRMYYCAPDTDKIGKTVFLTREEAERALEDRKDGD